MNSFLDSTKDSYFNRFDKSKIQDNRNLVLEDKTL